jgi:ABC-type sugar transport system substrate-binding protein
MRCAVPCWPTRWVSTLALCAALGAGCDAPSLLPPPPRRSPAPAVETVAALEMILDEHETASHGDWYREFPRAAERRRIHLLLNGLRPGEPAAKQAEMIRGATARHAKLLLVEPAPAPEVADALRAAHEQGVALVLLNRPVAALRGAPSVTLVAYEPLEKSARRLAAAARDAARARHPTDPGVALLLDSAAADSQGAARSAALRRALNEDGVALAQTLTFSGNPEQGARVLEFELNANPRITMVFAQESQGFACAAHVARDVVKDRALTLAGYTDLHAHGAFLVVEGSAAAADVNMSGFVAAALDAAVTLSRGGPAPPRVEVPLPVRLGGQAAPPAKTAGSGGRAGS